MSVPRNITTIRAKFVGSDNSMGYRRFYIYQLFTWIQNDFIVIQRKNGDGRCPYRNAKTFAQNWEILKD